VAAGYPVRSILLAERRLGDLEALPAAGAPVYVVPDETAERLTGYRVHRGALASLHRKPLPEISALAADAQKVIVLEDLVDHANVGAIFRCAAALGVDAVFLSPRCADPLYRRAVKVSMGAVFAIPYARMTGWYDGLADLRAAGFRLLALTPDASAVPLTASLADGRIAQRTAQGIAQRIALLLGTEGDGLSSRWRHEADQAVRIPMHPGALAAGVDSLNVVAAAAIACHVLGGGDQARSVE
ncbi:MAG TPA: RNA methyltransferase, partial [Streptosporangiaceae bacterium]|nr:RNA methyltransferase [Streptosporangiaceae bacterium]